jgi:hypothetical protein
MNNLFEKYPVISYNDSICVNVLAKVQFNDTSFNNTALFYPYTIKEGERPDHIALNYYGDSRYIWAVYLSNKIVDPYYEWPLDHESFKSYIVEKYGSYENSVEKISHYRTAYTEDDRMFDSAMYEALPAHLRKYWRPVINDNGSTLFYVRKEQDLVVETNKIVEISVANTATFIVGENVYQSNTTGGVIATGNIKAIPDSTTLVIRHVDGSLQTSNASLGIANIHGYESKANHWVNNGNTLYTAIPADEYAYWEPVTYYTYEDELNTSRKFIQLLDSAYIDKAEKEIQDLL